MTPRGPTRARRPHLVLLRGGLDDASAEWSSFCDRLGWSQPAAPMPDELVARLKTRLSSTTARELAPESNVAPARFGSQLVEPAAPPARARQRGLRGALVAIACAAALAASWAAGAAGVGRDSVEAERPIPAAAPPAPPASVVPEPAQPPSAEPPESLDLAPTTAPSSAPSAEPGIASNERPAPRRRRAVRAVARAEAPRADSNEPRPEAPRRAEEHELATAPLLSGSSGEPALGLASLAAAPPAASLLATEPSAPAWQHAPAVSAIRADRRASWSLSPDSRRVYGASLAPSLQTEGLPSVGVMAQLDVGRALGAL